MVENGPSKKAHEEVYELEAPDTHSTLRTGQIEFAGSEELGVLAPETPSCSTTLAEESYDF